MAPHKETYQAKMKKFTIFINLMPQRNRTYSCRGHTQRKYVQPVGTKWTNPDRLAIEAVREGEVPGTHSITYTSEVDSIQLTHEGV